MPTSRSYITAMMIGYVGFPGMRVWEVIDLWATPPEINRRYKALKSQNETKTVSWEILPNTHLDGGQAALSFRF